MADSEKGTPKQYRWRNGNQYLAVIAGYFQFLAIIKFECF